MSVSASGNYGVTAAAGSGVETVSLSGTLVSPNIASAGVDTAPQNAWWHFGGAQALATSIERGQTQRTTHRYSIYYLSINTGTEWVIPNDFQNGPYWIRAQHDVSGSNVAPNGPALTTITKIIGSADNVADWYQIVNGGVGATWGWQEAATFGTTVGIIKVEISTTNTEAGIIATGYYKGSCSTSP